MSVLADEIQRGAAPLNAEEVEKHRVIFMSSCQAAVSDTEMSYTRVEMYKLKMWNVEISENVADIPDIIEMLNREDPHVLLSKMAMRKQRAIDGCRRAANQWQTFRMMVPSETREFVLIPVQQELENELHEHLEKTESGLNQGLWIALFHARFLGHVAACWWTSLWNRLVNELVWVKNRLSN